MRREHDEREYAGQGENGAPDGFEEAGGLGGAGSADFAPTVEFPVVRRKRRGLHRIIAVIIALAVVAGALFVVDQRRALAACMTAETAWTEASAAAVAAGDKRSDPPAVCPSNAFGSDLRRYAAQLGAGAKQLNARAAALQAKREAEMNTTASSGGGSGATALQSAKSALEATLTEAKDVLSSLDGLIAGRSGDGSADASGAGSNGSDNGETSGDDSSSSDGSSSASRAAMTAARTALQSAYDKAKALVDASDVTDSRYYKAAAVTLQEAVDAANRWIDTQSAKAK